jgi:5-methylcytosine-specific restriction endonuclease McrA
MYGHVCAYCSKFGDTLDHVLPRSRDGNNTWDNVVNSCFKRNSKKSDHLLSELGWRLPFELKLAG